MNLLATNEEPDKKLNVYFQPPANVQMKYPAIVYQVDKEDTKFADNGPYAKRTGYQVTVIDSDPETPIRDKVSDLPLCSFSMSFVADNLNHYVYSLFF